MLQMMKSISMLDLFWYVCPMFFSNDLRIEQVKDEEDWGHFVDFD